MAPDSDSDEEEPNEIPPPHDRLPTYIDPNADADFLKGEWGYIHTANDLWGCDLNAFEDEEWRRHIAVLFVWCDNTHSCSRSFGSVSGV